MSLAERVVREQVFSLPALQNPKLPRKVINVEHGVPINFYGAKDGRLHANGMEFRVKGINWYGTDGKMMVLEGLDRRPIGAILDFLAEHEFNALRLLFNMQDWRDDPRIPPSHYSPIFNPQMVGMSYRSFLRFVIREAAKRGILILLACHRLRRFYADGDHAEWPRGWDGWWFDDQHGLPMAKVQSLWGEMATIFCSEWNVFGAGEF